MKTDIEIARETKLNKIEDVAEKLGVPRDEVQNYGRYIAKVPIHLIDKKEMEKHNLILVSAITPNKAGVGKTTVSIGLSLGLNKIGKKAVVALREPSLGPCFGMKGGAAGGGYSQVLPMENINLHFTGDFHAVTSAHNMITALLDNYIYQNRNSCEGLKEVKWKRVLDVNDRSLRNIVSGLGGSANGIPTETGFDITAASEIMAILCLATDIDDLKRRVGNILLGYTYDGKPFTVNDMGIAGAITVLLKDALLPNLVQTTENTPAFRYKPAFAVLFAELPPNHSLPSPIPENKGHGCSPLFPVSTDPPPQNARGHRPARSAAPYQRTAFEKAAAFRQKKSPHKNGKTVPFPSDYKLISTHFADGKQL